jgi:hypothetical protein
MILNALISGMFSVEQENMLGITATPAMRVSGTALLCTDACWEGNT